MFTLDEGWPQFLLSEKKKKGGDGAGAGGRLWGGLGGRTFDLIARVARFCHLVQSFRPVGGAAWFAGRRQAAPGGTLP